MNLKQFLLSIKKPSSLMFHKDSDGVTSAVLVARFLDKTGQKPDFIYPNDAPGIEIGRNIVKRISEYPVNIFVDLAIDQLNITEKLKGRVLIVDHHIPHKNLNSDRILHINPRFQNSKAYQPASYIIYNALQKELKKSSWIAGVGVVGDYAVAGCKDLMDKIAMDYPKIIPENRYSQKEVRESLLGLLSNMVEASKGVAGISGIQTAFDIFFHAKSPEDVMESQLLGYYKKFEAEISKLKLDFDYNKEFFSRTKSYIYEVRSKYNVMSALSNVVSEQEPDHAFFLIRKNRELQVGARCQSGRINVSELLKEVTGKLGYAGGHEKAAGASISKINADEFMERLRERLSGVSSL